MAAIVRLQRVAEELARSLEEGQYLVSYGMRPKGETPEQQGQWQSAWTAATKLTDAAVNLAMEPTSSEHLSNVARLVARLQKTVSDNDAAFEGTVLARQTWRSLMEQRAALGEP